MRYFFHILDGTYTVDDQEGAIFPDRKAAMRQAAVIAWELAQNGDLHVGYLVRIVDEEGNESGTVPVITWSAGHA